MTNKELYQRTFSQVRSSTEIRWEDYQKMKGKNFKARRLITLVAVIGILAVLSAAAVAVDLFGIRSMLLPEKTPVGVADDNGVLIPGETEEVDAISLSGLQDTPESRALAEWQAFLDGYDQDGSIIAQIGNSPTGFESRYSYYQVYTQEMADKLEEIVEKYGLKLHQQMEFVGPEEWNGAVGPFLMGTNYAYSGYIYEDGTFHYDGDAELPDYGKIDYQFSRSVRGTFHDVILNITDADLYESWTYETVSGVPVTLALGPAKGLILADLEDSFVAVNVLAGSEEDPGNILAETEAGGDPEYLFSSGPITGKELEALADLFYFPALTPVKDPDLTALAIPEEDQEEDQEEGANADPGLPEEMLQPDEDPLYTKTGIESEVAVDFTRNLSWLLENGEREAVAELFVYPCAVKVADGTFTVETPEELLEYYDEAVEEDVRSYTGALEGTDLFAHDGLVSAGDGTAWFGLVEDGTIKLFSLWNPSERGGFGIGRVSMEITQG